MSGGVPEQQQGRSPLLATISTKIWAESSQIRDTNHKLGTPSTSPSATGSPQPTPSPISAGSEGAGGGSPRVPPPSPLLGAHLCRWHTRSGRCGDTPSGSSPPWPPLAGSSSTSEHAAGRERETERPRQSPKWPPLSPSCPPGSALPPAPVHRATGCGHPFLGGKC